MIYLATRSPRAKRAHSHYILCVFVEAKSHREAKRIANTVTEMRGTQEDYHTIETVVAIPGGVFRR